MYLFLKYFCCVSIVIAVSACTSSIRYTQSGNEQGDGEKITGVASYYADKFEGRKTSNGDIYSHKEFTAAHRQLPFGTKVKVSNIANGKSVIVRINDRGPFAEGRIIDLSKAAAEQIDMIRTGTANVEIEIIK